MIIHEKIYSNLVPPKTKQIYNETIIYRTRDFDELCLLLELQAKQNFH